LAQVLRGLDQPILGRIADNQLILDLRCLENPDDLIKPLAQLKSRLAGQ
jgi:L-seryl-tRNA(Ser) seleniumtransferase